MMNDLDNLIHQNMSNIPENYNAITLSDIFDKVYVISLPQRREYILDSLKTFDVHPEIIEAVWKGDIPFEEYSTDTSFKNAGQVACLMSHIKALQTFLANENLQTVVIFEDDVSPCNDKMLYIRRLNSLKNELRRIPQWDIIYLGHCYSDCKSINFITEQISNYANSYCLHAYVINRVAAQKIIDYIHNRTIDGCLRQLISDNHLKGFLVFPSLFHQNRNDIQSELGEDSTFGECSGTPGFFRISPDGVQNKEIDSKIAIVTVSIGNRKFAEYTTKRMLDYANKHGYHLLLYRRNLLKAGDGKLNPHWNKIKAVQKALDKGYDTVAWVDDDIFIMDLNMPIEHLMPEDKDITFSRDVSYLDYPTEVANLVNTGLFILRNSEISRQFVSDWWDRRFLKTVSQLNDQSTGNVLVLHKYFHEVFIHPIGSLQSLPCYEEGDIPISFSIHLTGGDRKGLDDMLEELNKSENVEDAVLIVNRYKSQSLGFFKKCRGLDSWIKSKCNIPAKQTSNTVNIVGYDSRQQTSIKAIEAVKKALQKYEDPSILVFGSGYDSGVWHNMSKNTVILEHEDEWTEIGRKKGADVRKVVYVDVKGDISLAKDLAKKNLPTWLNSLDEDVTYQKWDVIIIDGPQGWLATRAMPVYASIYLSNKGGTIFVDDYNRKAEMELVEELKKAGMHLQRVINTRDGFAEVINE
jgi:GR25 family glycosyltransferase involved in LPS biosynthesis